MSGEDNRSVRQIEEEIESTRDQLASTIDQLVYRTKPSTILRRQGDASRNAFHNAVYWPDGSLRVDRIAFASAAVLALVALGVYRRTRG